MREDLRVAVGRVSDFVVTLSGLNEDDFSLRLYETVTITTIVTTIVDNRETRI
jgi:hypothetical protein